MMNKIMMSLVVLGVGGCASTPLPAHQFDHSQASIRGAEEVGALGVPAAALHLQLAKDQSATAQQLASEGDERAVLVMARAEADAELAIGLAREVSVHVDAVKASEDLKAVRARGNP